MLSSTTESTNQNNSEVVPAQETAPDGQKFKQDSINVIYTSFQRDGLFKIQFNVPTVRKLFLSSRCSRQAVLVSYT
jgi:hypothetical protein